MEERREWRHETTLAAEPVSIFKARAFVCRHVLDHRLWHLVDPVRVVASELSTNALAGADSSFTLSLWESRGRVYVAVRNTSPAHLASTLGSEEPGAERQLRLTIITLLSQDWGVRPDAGGGTEVWASFAVLPHPG
jgi:hypothetical protein